MCHRAAVARLRTGVFRFLLASKKRGRFRFLSLAIALAFTCLAATATASPYSFNLSLFGQPGDQASSPATAAATGVSGVDLTRGSGLTLAMGVNSMNSSNWVGPAANDFYRLGFDLQSGYTATVDEFSAAFRSSATGPGFVNVLYSADGGPETLNFHLDADGHEFLECGFDLPRDRRHLGHSVRFQVCEQDVRRRRGCR